MGKKKGKIKIKDKTLLLVITLFFLVFSLSNAFALGISPGRVTFNFEPNIEKTVTLTIINTEHKAINVSLEVEGNWAQYVTLNQTEISFNKTEEIKTLSYNVRFPFNGGVEGVKARIIAIEIPLASNLNQGALVGARIAVEHQLYLITEIKESALENAAATDKINITEINITKVFVRNYTKGDIAKVEIEIFNPKTSLMENVYAAMFIYDSNGFLRSQFNSTIIDIEPKETRALEAFWNTQGFELGNYNGKLLVYYDNKTAEQDLKVKLEEKCIGIELGKFEEKLKKEEEKMFNIKKADLIIVLVIVVIVIAIIILVLSSKNLKNLNQLNTKIIKNK